MPIIPSNWTGLDTVNAIGLSGGSGGSIGYAYAKQLTTTITELDTFIDLVGVCNEPISREASLDLISGSIKLYWKNLDGTYTQIHRDSLIFNTGYNFVDFTLGQLGLSIKCSVVSELSLVLRWDKNINFTIYAPPVVVPDLITVVNNVIHINETLGLALTNPVVFFAYFPDNVGSVTGDWQKLWLGNFEEEGSLTNSPMFDIFAYDDDYNLRYLYPTQFNPYVFNISSDQVQWYVDNFFPLTGRFKMSTQWGDNDPTYRDVNIVSYDKVNNIFILGLI
jgi:hypothetical protein